MLELHSDNASIAAPYRPFRGSARESADSPGACRADRQRSRLRKGDQQADRAQPDVWWPGVGVGAALSEESEVDPRFGGFLNANIAEYQIPVNADIGSFEVDFIDEPDRRSIRWEPKVSAKSPVSVQRPP